MIVIFLGYEFIKNSPIQYITCEYDEAGNFTCDSFYPKCKFLILFHKEKSIFMVIFDGVPKHGGGLNKILL